MAQTSASSESRPVAIDLFAGAGGLSLGFEMAGFDVVSAVEYDPVHAATHLYNFPLTDVLCRDVTRIGKEELLESAARGWAMHHPAGDPWDGKIDVVIGGPSCQGFSTMGRREADDERNKLVGEFVRIVEQVRPRAFVMENVPGILSGQYESILEDALERLRCAGYTLADHSAPLDAAQFGVPQRRRRVVLMGVLDAKFTPRLPAGTHSHPVAIADALAGLPSLLGRSGVDGDLLELSEEQSANYLSAQNGYLATLSRTEYGYRAHPRVVDTRVLSGCRVTEHKPASVERFSKVAQGKVEPVSRAWRLATTSPSRTLRAGTGRERGAFSASRPLHPTEPRVISIREAARIHSFPDWFSFHTTNWHGHRQIGNAVPPLLARAIGLSVLQALEITPKPARISPVPTGERSLLEMTPTTAAEFFRAPSEEVPRARRRSVAAESSALPTSVKGG